MNQWRRGLLWAALSLLLVAAVPIVVLAAGVSLAGARWRAAASQHASAALGRPVDVRGGLRLTLRRHLHVHVADVHVANVEGFGTSEFASIGELGVALDLADLLRAKVRPHSVDASDIVLDLQRAADGRANWPSTNGQSTTPRDAAAPPSNMNIGPLRLQRVTVRYHDAQTAARHVVNLETLTASIAQGGAVSLAARGRLNDSPMQELTLTGGPVRLLIDRSAPWPFELQLTGPARIRATGAVDTGAGELRAEFDALTDNLQQAGALVNIELPALGAAALRGRAVARADQVQLTQLQGELSGAALTGDIAIALSASRPKLKGSLQIAVLDVAPLRTALAARRPSGERQTNDWQSIPLRSLPPLDTDLTLRVDQVVGLPLDVRAASLSVQLDERGLGAPLRATVAGIDVSGELRLDTVAATPVLSANVVASSGSLGAPARDLLGVDGVHATLGRLELRLAGRGATLGGLARDAQASLALRDLALRSRSSASAPPVPIRVNRMQLDWGSHGLRGAARANVRGEDVAVMLRGGRIEDLLDLGSMPLKLDAEITGAALHLDTRLAMSRGPTVLDFTARARRVGELARWVDVAPEAALPLDVRGRLRVDEAQWALVDVALVLGRSALTVDASGSRTDGTAVSKARVKAARLDLAELWSLRSSSANASSRRGTASAGESALPSIDLDVELAQVAVRRTTLSDVRIAAELRPSKLRAWVHNGKLDATAFDGVLDLDLRDTPRGRAELAARDVDLGALSRGLQLADAIEGRARAISLAVQTRGGSSAELVANASLQASLRDSAIALRSVPQRPVAEVDVRTATIDAAAGSRVRVQLDGTINAEPVQLLLRTGTLAELLRARQNAPVPFELSAQTADSTLALDGAVALPLGAAADLRLQLSGARLDRLSRLAQVELPPWGPWSIAGPLRATGSGYAVQDLEVRVGDSLLRGTGALDLGGERPRLALQIAAPNLQLDDFPLPDQLSDPQAQPRQVGVLGAARDVAGRTDHLLSAGFLKKFDASVDVTADAVRAGERRLGGGALGLRLESGRLAVDPAVLNLPGGSLRLSMDYDLKESDIDFAIAANAERFDYGFVVNRLGLGDDSNGLFSLRLNLRGTAPTLDSILRHANGTVDVAIWPNEMRSGMFKLWSANMILTVLTLIDPQRPSRMNCIVGRFDLKDGAVSDNKVIIDTTALRIRGAGQIDLHTEEINAVFRPRAKGVALFRLQQPLRVSGTLSNQRFGIDPRDTPEAVIRLVFSPILWPIEQLTLGPLPRDGADICTDPLRSIGL